MNLNQLEIISAVEILRQYEKGRRDFTCIQTIEKERLMRKILSGTDWRNSQLPLVMFRGSDLSGSNFENLDLSGSCNGGATFADSNFRNSIINKANLGAVDFTGAIFDRTKCSEARFYETTYLPDNTPCTLQKLRKLFTDGKLDESDGLPFFENEIITI
jgi:uncharacterized protein YjbI with pentapeptide repeats